MIGLSFEQRVSGDRNGSRRCISPLANALTRLVAWRRIQPVVPTVPKAPPANQLSEALRQCRGPIIAIAFASALVNILYLTGAIYMMEVYDRVLGSRSIPTLIGLSILALVLFATQGLLDLLRGRLLIRIGRWIGEQFGIRAYHMIGRLKLTTARLGRRAATTSRPRSDPRFPFRSRPTGLARSAVDTILPRRLLSTALLDRNDCNSRSSGARRTHASDGGVDPRRHREGDELRSQTQRIS